MVYLILPFHFTFLKINETIRKFEGTHVLLFAFLPDSVAPASCVGREHHEVEQLPGFSLQLSVPGCLL